MKLPKKEGGSGGMVLVKANISQFDANFRKNGTSLSRKEII